VVLEVGVEDGVPVFVGDGVLVFVGEAVAVRVGENVVVAVGVMEDVAELVAVFTGVLPGVEQLKFTSEMALTMALSALAANLKSARPPLTVIVTVWS